MLLFCTLSHAQKAWRIAAEGHYQMGNTVNNVSGNDHLRNYYSILLGRKLSNDVTLSIGFVHTKWSSDVDYFNNVVGFKMQAESISPLIEIEFTTPINQKGNVRFGAYLNVRKAVLLRTTESFFYPNQEFQFEQKTLEEMSVGVFVQYNVNNKILLQLTPAALVNSRSAIEQRRNNTHFQNLLWKETRIDLLYFRIGLWI
jgi:hypothetical protein